MSEVCVAMVGCGQIAEAHLKAVQACEGATLTFCVDIFGRAQSAAERYGANKHLFVMREALSIRSERTVYPVFPGQMGSERCEYSILLVGCLSNRLYRSNRGCCRELT